MDKQNLLTIGNLSKQTGVHVKSLRYYEQLGILLPAYTDPDTGYRYYTLSQIPVVDAIRVCIFLDIPLKEFTGFLTRDQRRIHYKKLFSHGTMLAHRKIRDIQEKLRLLEKFRKQMGREEDLLLHGEQAIHALPEKYCWVAPYAGKQHTPEFNILITRIFDDIDRCQLRLGAEAGPAFLPPESRDGAVPVCGGGSGRKRRPADEGNHASARRLLSLRHQAGKRHCGGARRFSGPFCAGI